MCYLNPSWWAGVDGGPRELERAVTTRWLWVRTDEIPAKFSQVQYAETTGLFEILFAVFQLLCRFQLFATPWTAACQATFSILHHLPEFAQTHDHWVADA